MYAQMYAQMYVQTRYSTGMLSPTTANPYICVFYSRFLMFGAI